MSFAALIGCTAENADPDSSGTSAIAVELCSFIDDVGREVTALLEGSLGAVPEVEGTKGSLRIATCDALEPALPEEEDVRAVA